MNITSMYIATYSGIIAVPGGGISLGFTVNVKSTIRLRMKVSNSSA